MSIALKYIGQAAKFGIPARDLDDEEVELYGGEKFLIATGLYEKAGKAKPKPTENKLSHSSSENKE